MSRCTNCGEDTAKVSLNGWYCSACGASWDFIAPENRGVGR